MNWELIVAALVFTAPFVFIAKDVHDLSAGYRAINRATDEVREELGDQWSDSAVETGLYHPTHEATKDSFARRAEADRRERFDPTEGWGDESIFDMQYEESTPAGVYRSG